MTHVVEGRDCSIGGVIAAHRNALGTELVQTGYMCTQDWVRYLCTPQIYFLLPFQSVLMPLRETENGVNKIKHFITIIVTDCTIS